MTDDLYSYRHLIILAALTVGFMLWALGYLLLAGVADVRRRRQEMALIRLESLRARMELEHHLADLMAARAAWRESVRPTVVPPLHAAVRSYARRTQWFQPVPH